MTRPATFDTTLLFSLQHGRLQVSDWQFPVRELAIWASSTWVQLSRVPSLSLVRSISRLPQAYLPPAVVAAARFPFLPTGLLALPVTVVRHADGLRQAVAGAVRNASCF